MEVKDDCWKTRSCVLFIFCIVLFPIFVTATVSAERLQGFGKMGMTIAYSSYDFSWTTERWSANDASYRNIRKQLDAMIALKPNLADLSASFKAKALLKPSDALAQFRWAYIAYQYADDYTITDRQGEDRLDGVLMALAGANQPYSYEYDRIRFLVMAYGPPVFKLESIGKRLLAKDTEDAQVKLALAVILNLTYDPEKMRLAQIYARQLVTKYPANARYYGLVAGMEYSVWCLSKRQSDADNAVAAYQKYLTVAPPDYAFRKDAAIYIQFIQQQQAEINKQRG